MGSCRFIRCPGAFQQVLNNAEHRSGFAGPHQCALTDDAAVCSKSWQHTQQEGLKHHQATSTSLDKVVELQGGFVSPNTGVKQLHLVMGCCLPGQGGCSHAVPAPSWTEWAGVWVAEQPFQRELWFLARGFRGFITSSSGACGASRVGPKGARCPKWKKSWISCYRFPKRQIFTLQLQKNSGLICTWSCSLQQENISPDHEVFKFRDFFSH